MKTLVKYEGRQSNSAYHRTGKSNWWLARKENGKYDFIKGFPRIRGDEIVNVVIDLIPGHYVLGVGSYKYHRADDVRRYEFDVKGE